MFLDGTTSLMVERSILSANLATCATYDGVGGGLCLLNNAKVFLVNSRIENNRCKGSGSAIYCATANTGGGGGIVTAFGCLFTGNRHETAPGTIVEVIRLAQTPSAGTSRLINTTVVSNYQGTVTAAGQGAYPNGHFIGLHALNSIIDGQRMSASGGDASGANAVTAHWTLQHTTVHVSTNLTGYGMGAFVGGTWQWNYTNTLAEALTAVDLVGSNRFHSVTESGTWSQALEANIDGTVAFGGSTEHPFTPARGNPNAVDNGLTRTSGGYTYVDANSDGDYDALTDVIVAGVAPEGNHYVCMNDLAGNPRLAAKIIDRGAYETAAVAKGSLIVIQ
jgi:predicted outer membrane repeat protein